MTANLRLFLPHPKALHKENSKSAASHQCGSEFSDVYCTYATPHCPVRGIKSTIHSNVPPSKDHRSQVSKLEKTYGPTQSHPYYLDCLHDSAQQNVDYIQKIPWWVFLDLVFAKSYTCKYRALIQLSCVVISDNDLNAFTRVTLQNGDYATILQFRVHLEQDNHCLKA